MVLNMRQRVGWAQPGDRIFSFSKDKDGKKENKGRTWTAPMPWSFESRAPMSFKWFATEASMIYTSQDPRAFLMSHPGARRGPKTILDGHLRERPDLSWERRDLRIYYSLPPVSMEHSMQWRDAGINVFEEGHAGYSSLVHLGGDIDYSLRAKKKKKLEFC